MSTTPGIQEVEMVRRIRDEHAKQLAGMSDAELIAFFRRAAEAARRDAREWRAAHPPPEPPG